MEETIICPYPGLRPFHEDEAIFFKGRDEHIEQITRQLEAKKFLMLTGASGDGKSSLVYAGLIPNARAGFFKAKFNNWVVADFRPERAPLSNMGEAIGNALSIGSNVKIEKELSYGFSSLIDLYKNSKYWVDQNSDSFKNLSVDDQKKTKRKGANLLILVDQFEEFFTNPENYSHGKVSIESQTVVNLLLETTRLAIEQDIPIYIVCTMRSDYIGQCASFRGLPEYIGYSQFFVPRLKRKEVYQVIEEPALLNGNKISKRLVEMLINEMNDGIDQLPVLQHALNQIWQKADKGTKEMDVIHFAKINGIPKNQLSKADRDEFETWFEGIPEFKKALFVNASLGSVLDAHANELYETSGVVLEDNDDATAKLIVEKTFKCLTKIDESRAVRNRMSLLEVTQIINEPTITANKVGKVLNVFRIQGNTFLKPFITNDTETHVIKEEDVLDITHESLIRNWNKLTDWAKEEYDNLVVWQDFNKQLQRWVEHNKSSGYLLPIGPLTFFETWFNNAKPNKYWLARYDEREISREEKLEDAEKSLVNANQFIKRSARRLFVSRTVMKYGIDKIITVFGLLLLIFSCTYFFFDFRKKENSYVISNIQHKGNELLKSKYIKSKVKANFILTHERLNPGTYKSLLKSVGSDSDRIIVLKEMLFMSLAYDDIKKENEAYSPYTEEFFFEEISLINLKPSETSDEMFIKNMSTYLDVIYAHNVMLRGNRGFKTTKPYMGFCNDVFVGFKKLLKDSLALKKVEDIDRFNRMLQAMPEIVGYDNSKLTEIADLLSPFKQESKKAFDILYPKEKVVKQNWNENITHNAGYYQLANIFALTGDFELLNRSYDSLILNNKNFLSGDLSSYSYSRFIYDLIITDNVNSDPSSLFIKKIESNLPFKSKYSIKFKIANSLLTEKRDMELWTLSNLGNRDWVTARDLQFQLDKMTFKQVDLFVETIVNDLKMTKDLSENEKNYLIALLYKGKAFGNNCKDNYDVAKIEENLRQAFFYYEKIDNSYLSQDFQVGEGLYLKSYSRSSYFKYPGYSSLSNTEPFGSWQIYRIKNKSHFANYVMKNKNLGEYYFSNSDNADVFNKFLVNYYGTIEFGLSNEYYILTDSLKNYLALNKLHEKIDKNAMLAYFALINLKAGDLKNANKYADLCDVKKLLDNEKLKSDQNKESYYRMANGLSLLYCKVRNQSKSNEIVNMFPDEYKKRNQLLYQIDSLNKWEYYKESISLMDTLINKYVFKEPRFGNKLFQFLGKLSTSASDNIAMMLMKDKADNVKMYCLKNFIRGKVEKGNYYTAITNIPDYISSSSQLELYSIILNGELERIGGKQIVLWNQANVNSWVEGVYENGDQGVFIMAGEE